MLDQYTVEQKLLGMNIILFVVITVIAVILMTQKREVPAEPPLDDVRSMLADIALEVRTQPAANGTDADTKFGEAPIFDTLIPLPTPTPTPAPTIPPPPDLAEAIQSWQVKIVSGTTVMLEDPRTRKDFTMDLDKKDEPVAVRFRNIDMNIYLDSVDNENYRATFKYTSSQGTQKVTKGMFDDNK